MLFEELNTNKRMDDLDEREVGSVVKSDKKSKKLKKKKHSSMSFNKYKFIKNSLTFIFSSVIIVGIVYVFYLGVKIFIGG